MKKVLPQAFLLTTLLLFLLSPFTGSAQCSCSGGIPANRQEHLVVLAETNQSNTVVSFPKFDPAIGTLNCVTLNDTLSIVSATGIRNYDPMPTEYEFQLTVNTKIEGPSLSRTNFKNLQYGPDLLDAFGSPTDSINYGPDTIYNNFPSARTNTSDMTAYLGATGSVNFTYTIGGGVIAVGGANYNAQVRTTTWGIFKLTYFWCENSVLATSVRNLSVAKAGDLVELQWQGPENSNQDNFKIETSIDGNTFTNLEQPTGTNITKSPSTKYKFKYRPDQRLNRKVFFRIRYEQNQQVKYSETRFLLPDNGTDQVSVYPNPAYKVVRLEVGDQVTGDMNVELSNQVGQVVYRKKVRMNGTNRLEMLLDQPPLPGIYFVKVRQNGSSKVYTGKLLFSR